jgi:tetratricopeptide (TPR) repeat protein
MSSVRNRLCGALAALAMFTTLAASAQELEPNWVSEVRAEVKAKKLDAAASTIARRLQEDPRDLEAQSWQARIWAWTGDWARAQAQYKSVLAAVPDDIDNLLGLSDVLLWQGKAAESDRVLLRAEKLQPGNPEIAERRVRLDAALHAKPEPQAVVESRKAAPNDDSSDRPKYAINLGTETDAFSFTTPANAQTIGFDARWSQRWSTTFTGMSYSRFGHFAQEMSSAFTYHLPAGDALTLTYTQGSHQQIAPLEQVALDYDRGVRLHLGPVRGLEFIAHGAQVWFLASQVSVVGGTAMVYLPREWMWSIAVNGAKTHFTGVGSSWSPAGVSKLQFPLSHRIRGEVGFGVGAENYSSIDQIGSISARTYIGGVHYSLSRWQEFSAFMAYQQRHGGSTQTSVGGGYGFRF